MLLWIAKVFLGWPWCTHKWVTSTKDKLYNGYNKHIGYRYYQECEKCGEPRSIDA